MTCDCQTPATRKSVRKLRRRLGNLSAMALAMLVCLGLTVGALTAGLVKLSAEIAAAATK